MRLKVVVHSGEALFHRVFNFLELAGVDVIIVHRLLKNSVTADQYLLLTEAARADVEFPEHIEWRDGTEVYENLGRLKTLVWLPGGAPADAAAPGDQSFAGRFIRSLRLSCRLFFAPFMPARGRLAPVGENLPARPPTWFALLTVLLTPLYLVVGAGLVLWHVLRTGVGKKE